MPLSPPTRDGTVPAWRAQRHTESLVPQPCQAMGAKPAVKWRSAGGSSVMR